MIKMQKKKSENWGNVLGIKIMKTVSLNFIKVGWIIYGEIFHNCE